jgi:hypothetical protein
LIFIVFFFDAIPFNIKYENTIYPTAIEYKSS